MNRLARIAIAFAFVLACSTGAFAQTKNFTPVDGANLRARIDNAIAQGRGKARGGRFWVGYQFEVRPGVAIDFEVVGANGSVFMSMDGTSVMLGSDYETRELGFFLLFDGERGSFTRAEVYNLQRRREFSGYQVYWAGRASNEESLNFVSSIIETQSPETNRLADRAAFAISIHDDARAESILTALIRKKIAEPIRSRVVHWLGYAADSVAKNSFLASIARDTSESTDARQSALSALGMSRAPTTLPLLQSLFETLTSRELRRRALGGIARNDNSDAAAIYLIRIGETETDFELRKSAVANLGAIAGARSLGALTKTLDTDNDTEIQKQAVYAISRRSKDEAIPILIRVARTHVKLEVRKQAIYWLGQTGDERAVAFFKELLAK